MLVWFKAGKNAKAPACRRMSSVKGDRGLAERVVDVIEV